MTDNGLAALVEWLDGDDGVWYDRFGLWLSGRRDTAWLAAKMIGERGVFLPDGTCGHEEEYLGYWRATNEALATIAALRGLDSAVATLGELNAIVAAERERIKAEVKALPTLVLPTGTYVDVEGVFDAVTEP